MEGGVCQGLTAFIMRVGLVVFPFRGGWVGGGEYKGGVWWGCGG